MYEMKFFGPKNIFAISTVNIIEMRIIYRRRFMSIFVNLCDLIEFEWGSRNGHLGCDVNEAFDRKSYLWTRLIDAERFDQFAFLVIYDDA